VIGPSRKETAILVRAWNLTEGDQALGGETVVSLHRDALRHTVTVAWTSGERAVLDGASWVVLARQALPAHGQVIALRSRFVSTPPPLPPMTARERRDIRRQADEWRRERPEA
jgi:hypothetical protein